MTYAITDENVINELKAYFVNGDWQGAYATVISALTTTSFDSYGTEYDAPISGTILQQWVWFNGAKNVNAGIGAFGNYIRDWTSDQYSLRTGSNISNISQRVQDASNSIAARVIFQTLTGKVPPNIGTEESFNQYVARLISIVQNMPVRNEITIPNIGDIANIDAAGAAAFIFNKEASSDNGPNSSPWAGTVLFANLGVGTYFNKWILNLGQNINNYDDPIPVNPGIGKQEFGTYDLIAAAEVTSMLKTVGNIYNIISSGDFGTYLRTLNLGLSTTSAESVATQAFFNAVYGPGVSSINIGGTIFNDIVGLVQSASTYIVGSVHPNSNLQVAANTRVLNGGPGGSQVFVDVDQNPGTDVLDGGTNGPNNSINNSLTFNQPDAISRTVTIETLSPALALAPTWRADIETTFGGVDSYLGYTPVTTDYAYDFNAFNFQDIQTFLVFDMEAPTGTLFNNVYSVD